MSNEPSSGRDKVQQEREKAGSTQQSLRGIHRRGTQPGREGVPENAPTYPDGTLRGPSIADRQGAIFDHQEGCQQRRLQRLAQRKARQLERGKTVDGESVDSGEGSPSAVARSKRTAP